MGKISINMANKKAYIADFSSNPIDQYLTQAHMASHYKRILSAKASVDCSVPKSMLLSVKYKDQLQRQNRQTKYQKGFITARSESWSSSGSSGRLNFTEPIQNPSILEHDEATRDLVNGCMTPDRTFISSQGKFSVLPCTANIDKETTQKTFNRCYSDLSSKISTSPRQRFRTFSSLSASLPSSQHCYRSFQDAHQKTYSGDLLEKHAHHFTNGQRFTPRILKNEAQSSLAHYRYYTPVKKKKLPKKKLVTQETQTDFNSSQDAPSLKNRMDRSHLASSQAVYNKQICSDEEREDRDVFPHNLRCAELQECFECPYDYSVPRLSSSNRIKSPTMRKVKAEEEELKYLEFICDVTSEILNRGLFSNRVLERIFERRIEESKHRLDEKLRHMLDELKEDLGCKPEKNWRISGCETVLEGTEMGELNNFLENPRFAHDWREDTSRTANISIDNEKDKSWDHRLHGNFNTDICYNQNVTENKCSHDSLENPRFAHDWREDTGRTANISIDNEKDKSWDHRLHGNFSADICDNQNVTGNKCPHDICGEQIQEVQDLEQDHRLFANGEENHGSLQAVDHSGHSTDYGTDFDGTAELTEIDNLAVSLNTVDVKEYCELEDAQNGSALSKDPETAFDDGVNLSCL
uniref:spermatogenesis-associated protein 7-like isoform X2 n=1 Tax=Pristiophorus japonicus TaxID=55135 RepID=UPI00398E5379